MRWLSEHIKLKIWDYSKSANFMTRVQSEKYIPALIRTLLLKCGFSFHDNNLNEYFNKTTFLRENCTEILARIISLFGESFVSDEIN